LVTQLATERAKLEALVGRIERQIDLLIEHRQAMITAAITGELDIPGLAA
jgi:type I restriction enzyme, S subunit